MIELRIYLTDCIENAHKNQMAILELGDKKEVKEAVKKLEDYKISLAALLKRLE